MGQAGHIYQNWQGGGKWVLDPLGLKEKEGEEEPAERVMEVSPQLPLG